MNKKKIIVISIVTAILVACVVTIVIIVSNSTKSYRVITVEKPIGEVVVGRKGKNFGAIEGMNLVSKDSLSTAKEAIAILLLDTDKHIVVEQNTDISIVATGNEEAGNVRVDIKSGVAKFAVDNKLNDESTFEVQTPNALLAIRGTEFMVDYDGDDDSTVIKVDSGVVHLEYENEEIDLTEGESAFIKDGELEEIKPINLYYLVNYNPGRADYLDTDHYTSAYIDLYIGDAYCTFSTYGESGENAFHDTEYSSAFYSLNTGVDEKLDLSEFPAKQYYESYSIFFDDYLVNINDKCFTDLNDKLAAGERDYSSDMRNDIILPEEEIPHVITFYGKDGESIDVEILGIGYSEYWAFVPGYDSSKLYTYTVNEDDGQFLIGVSYDIKINPRSAIELVDLYQLDEYLD